MGLCQEQGAYTPSHRAAHPALPGPGCCPITDPVFPAPSVPLGQEQLVQPHTLCPQRHRLWGPQPPRVGLQAGPAAGTPSQPYMVRTRSPGPARAPQPHRAAPRGAAPGPGSPPRGPGAAAGSRQPGWFPSGPGWIPAPPRGPPGIPAPTNGPPFPPHPSPAPARPGTPGLPWGPTVPHRGSGIPPRRGMGPELP